jgi:hypothetical protein
MLNMSCASQHGGHGGHVKDAMLDMHAQANRRNLHGSHTGKIYMVRTQVNSHSHFLL